ncbi:MAG: hypothetical protein ACUVR8_06220 [Acidobacteriota bacterium]
MLRGKAGGGCLLGACLVLLSGCATPPPRWNELIDKKALAGFDQPLCASRSTAPVADDLVVYLDGSGSMRGYLNQRGPSAYRETLRLLTEIGPLFEPAMKIHFRRVGGVVEPPASWDALKPTPDMEAFYNLPDTDLAAAVRSFAVNLEGKRTGPPPRMHVLITDGVQSIGTTLGVAFRDECLKLLEGQDGRPPWQATLFGIRSQFDGKVYSEIDRSRVIAYRTEDDKQTWRPFYLLVFSSDASQHDNNVARLRRELRKLESQPEMYELPLASCFVTGPPQVEVAGDASGGGLGPRVSRVKHKLLEASPLFNVQIGKDNNRRLSITIVPQWSEAATNTGEKAQQLADLVTWELTPVYPTEEEPGRSYPRLEDLQVRVEPQGTVITVQPTWDSRAKTAAWRIFRLTGRLSPKKRLPVWLEQWNTRDDRTVEQANRTYNLLAMWQGTWERSPVSGQMVANIYLAVGPK